MSCFYSSLNGWNQICKPFQYADSVWGNVFNMHVWWWHSLLFLWQVFAHLLVTFQIPQSQPSLLSSTWPPDSTHQLHPWDLLLDTSWPCKPVSHDSLASCTPHPVIFNAHFLSFIVEIESLLIVLIGHNTKITSISSCAMSSSNVGLCLWTEENGQEDLLWRLFSMLPRELHQPQQKPKPYQRRQSQFSIYAFL